MNIDIVIPLLSGFVGGVCLTAGIYERKLTKIRENSSRMTAELKKANNILNSYKQITNTSRTNVVSRAVPSAKRHSDTSFSNQEVIHTPIAASHISCDSSSSSSSSSSSGGCD